MTQTRTFPRRLGRLLLVLSGILVPFGAGEIAVRLYLEKAPVGQFERYASVRQLRERFGPERLVPHRYLGFVTSRDHRRPPNRHGRLGFRGDEVAINKPDGVFRILCLGGSTTYGDGVLDPAEAYPAQLEDVLRSRGERRIEVINGGVPGYSSLESLLNLQLRGLELEPDLVLLYQGINDVHARFVWPAEAYRPDRSGLWAGPGRELRAQAWESSALLRVLAVRLGIAPSSRSLVRISDLAETYHGVELQRQLGSGVYPEGLFSRVSAEEMLATNGLADFERNLRSLVSVARANGAEVVLSSFLYASELGAFAEFPGVDPYIEAIDTQNRRLRSLASEYEARFVDVAGSLEPSNRVLVDAVHFRARGNAQRAELFADVVQEVLAGRAAASEDSKPSAEYGGAD